MDSNILSIEFALRVACGILKLLASMKGKTPVPADMQLFVHP